MPERRHRCEHCGRVFVCEPCTDALMGKRPDSARLYADCHKSFYSQAYEELVSPEPWACPTCAKLPVCT